MNGSNKLFCELHFVLFRTSEIKLQAALKRQNGQTLLITGIKEITENSC